MQLSLNELVYVGQQIKDHGDMSFFKNLKVALKGDESRSLEAKGFLKGSDLYGPLLEAALVLAKAHKTARVVMQVPGGIFEKGVFTLEHLQVLVETLGPDMEITFLEDMKHIRFDISDHTGMSMQQHTAIEVVLDAKALLVALSLVDWVRHQALLDYAGVNAPQELTTEGFRAYLGAPIKNSVARLMCKFYGLTMPVPSDFDSTREILVKKNIISLGGQGQGKGQEQGQSLSLNTEWMAFAMNFAIPDTQIVLETYDGRLGDPVIAANNVILAAGIKDIAAFNATEEGFEFTTISSAELVGRVEAYLKCPNLR